MVGAPRVTVLMAVHNGERFLREALGSILGQTLADFELLVVDDGSTDETPALLASLTDPRIHVVSLEENRGLAVALNRGLDEARGRYVARMDADDVAHPARLEKQVQFLDANPAIGVCGTWVRYIGARSVTVRYPTDQGRARAALLFDPPVAHPSVMLRRDLFDEGLRYDPSLRRGQDYDLWCRAAERTGMVSLPEVLLSYRIHPAQARSEAHDEQQDSALRVRLAQIRKVGIEPSAEEMEIHSAIAACRPGGLSDPYERADAWLCRLFEANARTAVLDADSLAEVLVWRWFLFCKKGGRRWGGMVRSLRPRLLDVTGCGWLDAAGIIAGRGA